MAGGERELRIRIVGDSASGEKALTNTAKAADKLDPSLKKANAALGGTKNILGELGGLGSKVGASLGTVASSLSGPQALAAGAAAGLAAEVEVIKSSIGAFADATKEVRGFQRVSGASAEESSKLVYAFKALGVDSDKAGTAVFRLAHNLDGNQAALAKFGVQIAHNKAGGVDLTNTMLNVADAVHKAGAGAEADAIAFAAFGRQGTALLPVLLRGREGLQELFHEADRHHQVFSQADLESGRQFDLAMKSLKESLVGLEIEGGKVLIPFATNVARDGEKIIHFFDTVTNSVGGFVSHIPMHTRIIHGLTLGLADTGSKQKDLAASTAEAADAAEEQAKANDADAKALDTYGKAVNGVTDAQKARTKAIESVQKSQRDEATANRDLNDLLAKGAVDHDKVKEATKRVGEAAKSTADAQKAEAQSAQHVADAQQAVVDAQLALAKVKEGASAEEIAKAALARDKALRDQKRSALEVADAEDKKNSIIDIGVLGVGQSTGTVRDKEKAELDLADALDGVKEADFAAKDAQKVLDDTRNKGKEGSDDLKAAQDNLKTTQDNLNQAIEDQATAHQHVIDAQAGEVDAHDALVKAEEGDPDFADKVATARQHVADAHQATADAINNEADAIDGLIQKQKELGAYLASPEAQTTNVQTSAINGQDFRPVSRSAAQVIINNTIHSGADPNAINHAINQYASSNGGKPRGTT